MEEASPARKPPWIARLFVAHAVAYPIGFAWAIASVPALVPLYERELLRLLDEADVARFLVGKMLWPAGAAFVAAHVMVVPWLVMKDARGGVRWFWGLEAALLAVAVIGGGAGWIWLHLR